MTVPLPGQDFWLTLLAGFVAGIFVQQWFAGRHKRRD